MLQLRVLPSTHAHRLADTVLMQVEQMACTYGKAEAERAAALAAAAADAQQLNSTVQAMREAHADARGQVHTLSLLVHAAKCCILG